MRYRFQHPSEGDFGRRIVRELERGFAENLPPDLSHLSEPEKEQAAKRIFYDAQEIVIQSLDLPAEAEGKLKALEERCRRRIYIQGRVAGRKVYGLPHWTIDPDELNQFFVDFRDSMVEVLATRPNFTFGLDQQGRPISPEIIFREVDGTLGCIASGKSHLINDKAYLTQFCEAATQMHATQLKECLGDKFPEYKRRFELLYAEYEKRLLKHPEYPK